MGAHPDGIPSDLTHIPLSYSQEHSEESALKLVYYIRPKWREDDGPVEIVKFTDGITNTLLHIIKRRKGTSEEEQDNESILLRAYGNNTDILIDRDREAKSHALCAERDLAPDLLARFDNGLLYKFIRGEPTKPEDLTREPVWRGIANRLGEWHACLPISAVKANATLPNGMRVISATGSQDVDGTLNPKIESRQPTPNVWTVMEKWIHALPTNTETERSRQKQLQEELQKSFCELDSISGLGTAGFVLGHCDLLSGNVIVSPPKSKEAPGIETVNFIDYEYATPCPAAFDIANHFAEWGGFDCDYNMLPTRSVRRAFLKQYLESYQHHLPPPPPEGFNLEKTLDELNQEVDNYRGMPGLYWGIWALIQATISQIDFDYANYAETRLGEYWAWRASQKGDVADPPLRERRWTSEQ